MYGLLKTRQGQRCLILGLSTVCGLLAWALEATPSDPDPAQPSPHRAERVVVKPISSLELPVRSDPWRSLAWEDDRWLLLGSAHGTLGEVSVDAERDRLSLAPAGRPPQKLSYWAAAQLASDRDWRLVAGPFGGVAWGRPGDGKLLGQAAFNVTWDLDVQDSRGLVLGVRTDEAGAWALRGGVAWVGSLDRNLSDLKIVHRSTSGPGAATFGRCGILDVTRGAFLSGGRIVVVPGVEDGAFLYGPDGHLLRSWTSAQLGLDTDCEVSEQEKKALFESGHPRRRWLDQRRVVDDVVPWPGDGFAILRRFVTGGRVHWDLRCVEARTGVVTTVPLPFAAPAGEADWVRAKSVATEKRISVLVSDLPLTSQDKTTSGELWVAELQTSPAPSADHHAVSRVPARTASPPPKNLRGSAARAPSSKGPGDRR